MSQGKRLRFYHSQAWRKTRQAYIDYRTAIDGGLCEVCHSTLGDTVHHKIWLTDDNLNDTSISLNFDNFCLICRDCHAKQKDPEALTRSRYQFDDAGNLIPPFCLADAPYPGAPLEG